MDWRTQCLTQAVTVRKSAFPLEDRSVLKVGFQQALLYCFAVVDGYWGRGLRSGLELARLSWEARKAVVGGSQGCPGGLASVRTISTRALHDGEGRGAFKSFMVSTAAWIKPYCVCEASQRIPPRLG